MGKTYKRPGSRRAVLMKDSISYFNPSVSMSGIFLPINRARKRGSSSSHDTSFPLTPTTPSTSNNFKGATAYTPPTPSLPKFSQSVGPGRGPSPGPRKQRPSLPRPESPIRRTQIGARPSIGTPLPKVPARYATPTPGKFGQSVSGTQDSRDPSKKIGYTPRALKTGPRSTSALGQAPLLLEDELPAIPAIGLARTTDHNGSIGSVSSFNSKARPSSRANGHGDEVDRLRGQLEERDRRLKDQASALAEMESSLGEVQALMDNTETVGKNRRGSLEDKDAMALRTLIREKNDKIATLTGEFDIHRADFRSTIDTLELASNETERVYEKRVEELLQEIRELQDRNEDVESVAQQLKQLEELVQELEEGLEDARRGEAEARGEVEFLRGEVERTRSELRRERDKGADGTGGGLDSNGDATSITNAVEERDDEIRGLKAIIHSLSRDAVPDVDTSADLQRTPTQRHSSLNNGTGSVDDIARKELEREVSELRDIVESKGNREEELERELERLRRTSVNRTSGVTVGSAGTVTQDRSSTRDSKGTVVSWRERDLPRSPDAHRRKNTLETMPESDTYSSTNESFCELCETSGHDILTCKAMFNPDTKDDHSRNTSLTKSSPLNDFATEGLTPSSPRASYDAFKPAPLSPMKQAPPPAPPIRIIPNPMESGPVAGKESGMINLDKWCGVCEREGHDSIDCPFEDAF